MGVAEVYASTLAISLRGLLRLWITVFISFPSLLYACGLFMGSNLTLAATFRAAGLQKVSKVDGEPGLKWRWARRQTLG